MEEEKFVETLRDLIRGLYSKYMLNMSKICQRYDITSPQASVLMILKHRKALKVSEVAELINTPDSNVSAICSRLEQKNLIQRERDKVDRRMVYITSTPAAEIIFKDLEGERQKLYNVICANISNEEKDQIISALVRLNEVLEYATHTEK